MESFEKSGLIIIGVIYKQFSKPKPNKQSSVYAFYYFAHFTSNVQDGYSKFPELSSKLNPLTLKKRLTKHRTGYFHPITRTGRLCCAPIRLPSQPGRKAKAYVTWRWPGPVGNKNNNNNPAKQEIWTDGRPKLGPFPRKPVHHKISSTCLSVRHISARGSRKLVGVCEKNSTGVWTRSTNPSESSTYIHTHTASGPSWDEVLSGIYPQTCN